jgi:hypothetical protein
VKGVTAAADDDDRQWLIPTVACPGVYQRPLLLI